MNNDKTPKIRPEDLAIAEEMQRLRDIVFSIGAGLIILDEEMRIVWVNRVLTQWFGPRERLQGNYCFQAICGREGPCEDTPCLHAFQSKKTAKGEVCCPNIKRVYRVAATPLKNEQGEVTQVLSMIQDITEEKKTVQALVEAKERYRDLTENMPGMLYLADPNKNFANLYVNRAIKDIYGYGPEEKIVKKPGFWAEVIYSPDKKNALAMIRQAYRKGSDTALEYRIIDKSGNIRWVHDQLHWIKNKDGRILYLQGVVCNIDERKMHESRLRIFYSVLDHIIEAVFVGDPQTGLIEYINEVAGRLYGYERKALIGKPVDFFKYLENQPELKNQIMKATLKGGWEGEVKSIQNGKIIHKWMKTYLLLDELGQPWKYIGIHRDISQEKRMKEQLIHSERMSAIGNLAGWVAHEFNNLHAIIQGYIDLLFMKEDLSPELREYLDIVRNTSKKATAITRQLLTFTRRQATKKIYTKLSVIIEDTIKMLHEELTSQGTRLEVVHHQQVDVLVDPIQIGQVVMNLLINAQQAMIDTPQKNIRIETGKTGDQAFFRISDSGCGITKENLKTIFEPFYTTKKNQGRKKAAGTGLGLAISHTIVEDHDGDIDVESEVGRGTIFTVWLPVITEGVSLEPAISEGEINLQNRRILVIEDEKDIQVIISKALQAKGARVEEVNRGREGLRRIKKEKYAAVLVDLQIPDLKGKEILRLINELPQEQKPVKLIITGKATVEDMEELEHLEVDDILFKPFELEELYKAITAALLRLKKP